MSQEVSNPTELEKRRTMAIVLRAILAFSYVFVLLALVMFLPGGIKWTKGWVFVAVFLVETAIAIPYLWRKNPAIFVARSRIQKGIKPWDRVVMCFLFLSILAVFVVAALDDGRFHWSSAPTWLAVVGYVPFSMGFFLTAWAESVNPFAEPGVRIQTERGHKVVDSGPYAIVRHPMYLSALFLFPGVALVLGSFWALIPATLVALVLVVRTTLEDRTLQNELEGYEEYATRVRYRLIPGLW